MKIKNSVAFVTGADHGLGLWLAMELLARGARKVYAGVTDTDAFRGQGIVPIKIDVTDPESITAAAARCQDVSLLVNNAGMTRLTESTPDLAMCSVARERFETDFNAVVSTTQAFAPALLRNGGGAVINVLSDASSFARPALAACSATTSAASGFSNSLRLELRDKGTQVLALHLSSMDPDMGKGSNVKKTIPTRVAARTLDALEAGEEEVLSDEEAVSVTQRLDPMVSTTPSSNGSDSTVLV